MIGRPTYAAAIFGALQSKPVYAGTVAPGVVELRRAKNKRARLARRGKGQRVTGIHSPAVRNARYRALEQVARRSTTVDRQYVAHMNAQVIAKASS